LSFILFRSGCRGLLLIADGESSRCGCDDAPMLVIVFIAA
jgi:hypothetical protein